MCFHHHHHRRCRPVAFKGAHERAIILAFSSTRRPIGRHKGDVLLIDVQHTDAYSSQVFLTFCLFSLSLALSLFVASELKFGGEKTQEIVLIVQWVITLEESGDEEGLETRDGVNEEKKKKKKKKKKVIILSIRSEYGFAIDYS